MHFSSGSSHPRSGYFSSVSLPAFLCLLFLFSASGCREEKRHANGFCSLGSEEFNYLMDNWKDLYARKFPDSPPLYHEGKGNHIAPYGLRNKLCDLAPSTRPFSNPEFHSVLKSTGKKPIAIPVAVEALGIVVPRSLKINQISLKELNILYRNKPATLGEAFNNVGDDISGLIPEVFGQNSASDRYRWFKESILNGRDYSDRVLELAGPLQIAEKIATLKPGRAGFGYIRPAELKGLENSVKLLELENKEGKYSALNKKNLDSGHYSLKRYFYIYIPAPSSVTASSGKEMDKNVPAFLKLVLSKEGQEILPHLGLFPLSFQERQNSLAILNKSFE